MNKAIITGRLTRDPDVRNSNGENATTVARFTLAVDRRFRREGSEQTADFISCVAFGRQAEFIEKYFHKGMKMNVVGRIQTGNYTRNDGIKVYTTDVICEDVEFGESKANNEAIAESGSSAATRPQQAPPPQQGGFTTTPDGFMNIPDGIDDELPFT